VRGERPVVDGREQEPGSAGPAIWVVEYGEAREVDAAATLELDSWPDARNVATALDVVANRPEYVS
jgi:hypothetical protein